MGFIWCSILFSGQTRARIVFPWPTLPPLGSVTSRVVERSADGSHPLELRQIRDGNPGLINSPYLLSGFPMKRPEMVLNPIGTLGYCFADLSQRCPNARSGFHNSKANMASLFVHESLFKPCANQTSWRNTKGLPKTWRIRVE